MILLLLALAGLRGVAGPAAGASRPAPEASGPGPGASAVSSGTPGPGLAALHPTPPAGLDLSVASCAGCHEEQAATWARSRHAVAGTNALFWEAWTRWPNGWCVNCHAPLREGQVATLGVEARPGVFPAPRTPQGLWTEGVNCATCHLDGGEVRSAREPSAEARAAHPIRVDPSLAGPAACAACHEFPFQVPTAPAAPFRLGTTLAQATVQEHATSRAAAEGKVCQTCHMGRHGHAMPGAHDPERLRRLLKVEARREGEEAVLLVRAPGAAHRVPTGDPFRRLTVQLCRAPGCEEVLAAVVLRRVFALGPEGFEQVLDRTIPPETPSTPAERELRLPAAGARWWRLVYALADARHEAALPEEERGYLVAEGPL